MDLLLCVFLCALCAFAASILSAPLNPRGRPADTSDMDGPLPEEFPFRKPAPPTTAAAVEPVVAAAPPAPPPPPPVAFVPVAPPAPVPAPEARVERVEAESLIEVAAGPRVVYRGRERRRSPRQALRAKAVYRDDAKPASGGAVQVVNISMFGVRFWSTRPMAVGDRGGVRMELGPVKWAGRVRVVTCAAIDDDGFVIGCEFVANEVAPRRRVDAA